MTSTEKEINSDLSTVTVVAAASIDAVQDTVNLLNAIVAGGLLAVIVGAAAGVVGWVWF